MAKRTSQNKNNKKSVLSVVIRCTVVLLIAAYVALAAVKWYLYPVRLYTASIEKYSTEYELDPLFVYAVIHTESGFDARAESGAGARGLMQITDETYQWIKSKIAPHDESDFEDMFGGDANIWYGCYFLSRCIDRYGDLPTAIAAYHSGWGTVDALLQNESYSSDGITLHTFPYPQMERYVKKVTCAYEIYQMLYR